MSWILLPKNLPDFLLVQIQEYLCSCVTVHDGFFFSGVSVTSCVIFLLLPNSTTLSITLDMDTFDALVFVGFTCETASTFSNLLVKAGSPHTSVALPCVSGSTHGS